MDEEDQKQFIKDIMSFKKSLDDESHKDFYDTVISQFESEISDLPGFKSHQNFDINEFMKACSEANMHPIDVMEWTFNMLANIGKVEFEGKSIDLSQSSEIFNQLKEKFIKHKEANDIKNF